MRHCIALASLVVASLTASLTDAQKPSDTQQSQARGARTRALEGAQLSTQKKLTSLQKIHREQSMLFLKALHRERASPTMSVAAQDEALWLRSAMRVALGTSHGEVQSLELEKRRIQEALGRLQALKDSSFADELELKAPTKGAVLQKFGARRLAKGRRVSGRGITLSARANERVVSPLSGQVIYVGPVLGHGIGMIIDAGSAVALVSDIEPNHLKRGDRVHAGEPIGRAPSRRVHYELRRSVGGALFPIDPTASLSN